MASFAQLRSQIRALETKTENRLSDYSGFVQSISSSPTETEIVIVKDIEDGLDKRETSIEALSRLVDSDPSASATKLHQLQRHKEVLTDHKTEFKRVKNAIQQERNRTNLLTSVRSDIANHRARSATPGMSEADYMLEERSRIDNSHNLADTLLAQAYETREEFVRQRASLANIQRRILQTVSHVPGLNTLISKVNTRKKRDSIIVASLITTCILFLFFFR
jgi:Golgi SNAP receptor complex protein 1